MNNSHEAERRRQQPSLDTQGQPVVDIPATYADIFYELAIREQAAVENPQPASREVLAPIAGIRLYRQLLERKDAEIEGRPYPEPEEARLLTLNFPTLFTKPKRQLSPAELEARRRGGKTRALQFTGHSQKAAAKALLDKRGRAHMSEIGKRGHRAATAKYPDLARKGWDGLNKKMILCGYFPNQSLSMWGYADDTERQPGDSPEKRREDPTGGESSIS